MAARRVVLGDAVAGRLIHAAYDTPSGCALRSRFWLGWGVEAPPDIVKQAMPDKLGLDPMLHANGRHGGGPDAC